MIDEIKEAFLTQEGLLENLFSVLALMVMALVVGEVGAALGFESFLVQFVDLSLPIGVSLFIAKPIAEAIANYLADMLL